MTEQILGGMNVAILVVDGFEQAELSSPFAALQEAGANPKIISHRHGQVQGFHHEAKADKFDVALSFDEADADDFDAVVLPGGVFNSDKMRMIAQARQFVREMQDAGKPIAVICHGAWLLVSSDLVRERTMTSWPSLQDDIRNAGGRWVDEPVVVDGNLISSRKPDDLPAFNRALLEQLSQRFVRSARGTPDEQAAGLSS
jgi:protease I